MGHLIHTTQWLTGLIFLPAGLALLARAPLSGMFLAAAGAMILPPLRVALLSRLPVPVPRIGKGAAAVGLLFASMIALPTTAPSATGAQGTVGLLPSPDIVEVTVVVTATPQPTIVPSQPSRNMTPTRTPTQIPTVTSPPATATLRPPTVAPSPVPPTSTPYIPVQQFAPAAAVEESGGGGGGAYTCNCGKTCGQMSSCAEAQYQLNVCGCGQRDADNDGIACDSDCQ